MKNCPSTLSGDPWILVGLRPIYGNDSVELAEFCVVSGRVEKDCLEPDRVEAGCLEVDRLSLDLDGGDAELFEEP